MNKSSSLVLRRRSGQRGSALLVVLVLAAIIAIMLYRELPIAAFEAQRQREQLAISRGNEYKRGVKLFVRKIGRFPSSLNELENTNRMRFLRHKYVDPLTGKDDWRLIHAGPGGVIIDSKVQTDLKKNANALGQGAVFAGFNNTFVADQTALGDASPVSAALRQRAPATKNAATVAGDTSALPQFVTDAANGDNVATPPQPGVFNSQPPFDPATGQAMGQPANLPGQAGNPNEPNAGGGNGIGSVAQQLNNVNPRTPEQAGAGQTSAFGNQIGGQPGVPGQAGNGVIGGAGGIAGVASIAKGKSIKAVEDQTKYSLWEFYYDLRKDQANGQTGVPQGVNNGINTNNGSINGQNSGNAFGNNNNGNSAFGNNNNSAFGSNAGQTGSGFASGSSQQQPTAPPPPPSALPPPQ